jgi:hypothetical protein
MLVELVILSKITNWIEISFGNWQRIGRVLPDVHYIEACLPVEAVAMGVFVES